MLKCESHWFRRYTSLGSKHLPGLDIKGMYVMNRINNAEALINLNKEYTYESSAAFFHNMLHSLTIPYND